MRVLIIGAGAIGLWLGAYLVRSGNPVTFVGRPRVTEAIARDGLTVTQADGQTWTVNSFDAVTSIRDAATMRKDNREVFDLVIFTVKAYSLVEAVRDLTAVWGQISGAASTQHGQPVLVCFQNGVGCEEIIAEAFGRERVVSATTTSPVVMAASAPGAISEARSAGCICLAPVSVDHRIAQSGNSARRHGDSSQIDDASLKATVGKVADVLSATGLDVRQYGDHRALKWSKMVLNILGNATGAILDMPVGDLYRDARVFDLEMRMLSEAGQVMKRLGIRALDLPHFPAALMLRAAAVVPHGLLRPILRRRLVSGRGDKRPSFYYDVARSARSAQSAGHSEVQWLNGAVARHGEELGIPTPVNARLTTVLTDLVSGAQDPGRWRGRVDKLAGESGGAEEKRRKGEGGRGEGRADRG